MLLWQIFSGSDQGTENQVSFRDEDDAKIGTAEKESDDDSDDENIPEPEVGEIEMSQV